MKSKPELLKNKKGKYIFKVQSNSKTQGTKRICIPYEGGPELGEEVAWIKTAEDTWMVVKADTICLQNFE